MHEARLERPWRADARAAGTVGLAHLSSHFFQLLLPPIYPWLMRDFGIGYTEAGLLATVFFVVSGFGQALAGFAVDRYGAFRVLQFGVVALALSGVILGLSHSYEGVLATAAVAGVGNAIFHPADFTILNRRVSPARLGHAFAMHGLTGSLGWVAGASFMTAVTSVAGWHAAGFGAAAVALAALVLLSAQREELETEPVPAGHAHAAAQSGQFAFLRSPVVWYCFAFFFLSTGAGGVLQNFAPSMLGSVYGVTPVHAALCLTAYLLGSATGTLAGGFVASRERRSARVVALALAGAALIAAMLASGAFDPSWLVPALFLLGCGTGAAAPSRDLLVRQAATTRFGPGSFGRVYGFVYSGVDSGLALMPLLVGRLLDGGGFRGGLLCIAGLQAAAIVVALRVGKTSGAAQAATSGVSA